MILIYLGYALAGDWISVSPHKNGEVSDDRTVIIGNLTYTLLETYTQSEELQIVDNTPIYIDRYNAQANSIWNLDRVDQRTNVLNSVYNYQSLSGNGVWNYVLDTGIQTSHPEFEGRAIWGVNFADSEDEQTGCMHFHGTHVAGTIGSKNYGVAKGTTLVSVKVLDCFGGGSLWNVLRGIEWVIAQDKKKKVINMSLTTGFNQAFNSAIDQAISMGIVVVVAAGNQNDNACNFSPSSSNAIVVGATDMNTVLAGFSNWGNCVDIFAPGVGILSTTPGSQTGMASGTSMASPHVAGVVSLILDAYRGEIVDVNRILLFLKRVSSKGKISGDIRDSPNEFLFSIPSFV